MVFPWHVVCGDSVGLALLDGAHSHGCSGGAGLPRSSWGCVLDCCSGLVILGEGGIFIEFLGGVRQV